ncbi:DUF2461 domain-containing protein [Microbacterium sp. B2969]|uniref:DUF2461 domain-containing protein n=1 Tax=Microbacterium alkaliflavum TaxID=3248839 RepID=A0ABW7Q6Q9_9MICO
MTQSHVSSGFEGWPPAALEFYRGLEADNSKAYFTAHRAVYDDAVAGPALALLDELAPEYGEGKIFRPHRDVRFSADKSPYKTSLGVMIGSSGFVHLDADRLMVGTGRYDMSPAELTAYRGAVDAPASGEELQGIADELRADGFRIGGHDAVATVPRGFDRAHPRAELLRLKGIAATRTWPADEPWVATAEAKDRIVEAIERAAPLRAWLSRHLT